MIRRALFACAVIALAASAGGCVNPFQPATPEPPTGSPVIENFTTPDKLLATMADAIMKQGSSGRNAYYDALADSTGPATPAFYAFHYPAVVDAWRITAKRDPPNPWGLRLEKLFYDSLISILPGFNYTFTWVRDETYSQLDQLDETAGTALYHRYYELQASSSDGGINKLIAVGYADLYMQKVNSRWFLVRWEDRVSPAYGVNPADSDNRSMGWRRLDSTGSQ